MVACGVDCGLTDAATGTSYGIVLPYLLLFLVLPARLVTYLTNRLPADGGLTLVFHLATCRFSIYKDHL